MSELESDREESVVMMHWRQYVLDNFVSSDISQEFLDKIRADLDVVRTAKFTIIVRFMYADDMPDVSVHYVCT